MRAPGKRSTRKSLAEPLGGRTRRRSHVHSNGSPVKCKTKSGALCSEKPYSDWRSCFAIPLARIDAQERATDGPSFGVHAVLQRYRETNVRVGGHVLLPLNTWLDLYPSVGIELWQSVARVRMSAMARFRPFQRRVLSQFYGAAGVATLRDGSDTEIVDRLVIGAEWPFGRWKGFVEWEALQWFSGGSTQPQAFGILVGFRQRPR